MTELRSQHDFAAPVDAVIAAMSDPGYHAALELPDVAPPELLRHEVDGARTIVEVRFEFAGTLDPIARRVVGNDRIAWVQTITLDPIARRAELVIRPDVRNVKVTCRGTFTFLEHATDHSRRNLVGELKVHVPLIGGRAEAAIAPGIRRRLDLEAEGLARRLASG